MSETLHIKNFGPIKDVHLNLKKFNVIIGENATGKSTVAKILAICRYFSFIYEENFFGGELTSSFLNGLREWGLTESVQEDSYIYYECDHYSVTVKNRSVDPSDYDSAYGAIDHSNVSLFISELKAKSLDFENLLATLKNIRPKIGGFDLEDTNWTIPRDFFQNEVPKVIINPFYFPTERGLQSFFVLPKGSIERISSSLYNQIADISEITQFFKSSIYIDPLDIYYQYENVRGGRIRKNNDKEDFSLFNAASGYQSTIPLVLIIKYYTEIRKKRKAFIIQEPELNLFPDVQNKLVHFFVDNIINYFDNSILLTTHSPYILTSLNNLMYAYEVGQKEPEKVNKITDKKYWINPNDVSAYMLLNDGTCEDIIDTDEDGGTLIRAQKIDEISTQLNVQFDKLIDLEIQNRKA